MWKNLNRKQKCAENSIPIHIILSSKEVPSQRMKKMVLLARTSSYRFRHGSITSLCFSHRVITLFSYHNVVALFLLHFPPPLRLPQG